MAIFEPRSALDENWGEADVKNTLRADASKSSHAIVEGVEVRRLTPRECERLMGWPDDHTRWRWDGREVSDSTRYKMCGNGVAAPCVGPFTPIHLLNCAFLSAFLLILFVS